MGAPFFMPDSPAGQAFSLRTKSCALPGASVMLAVKVRMEGNITIEQAVDRINLLEKKLKAEVPSIGWCFVEPDCQD